MLLCLKFLDILVQIKVCDSICQTWVFQLILTQIDNPAQFHTFSLINHFFSYDIIRKAIDMSSQILPFFRGLNAGRVLIYLFFFRM
jgi:hypothetical protein